MTHNEEKDYVIKPRDILSPVEVDSNREIEIIDDELVALINRFDPNTHSDAQTIQEILENRKTNKNAADDELRSISADGIRRLLAALALENQLVFKLAAILKCDEPAARQILDMLMVRKSYQ